MQPTAIQASNLSFQYPKSDFKSLAGVSLAIRQGSCTGLIGPNGAGKSTLISALTGLLQPQQGQVNYPLFADLPLAQVVQQHVALVPQDFAFYQQLTVAENLSYFAGLTGLSRAEAVAAIAQTSEQCQLVPLLSRPAKQLSGGNKRKLNLAIALLKDPQIIFLDEPTVGVDPVSREALVQLIQGLNQAGKTLIYTSHLLNEVQAICDEVYVMNQGQVSRFDPQQSKRLQLEFSQPVADQELQALCQFGQLLEQRTNQVLLQPDSPQQLQACLAWLSHSSLEIEQLSYQPHSLSQFYCETFS